MAGSFGIEDRSAPCAVSIYLIKRALPRQQTVFNNNRRLDKKEFASLVFFKKSDIIRA
jgi:hypothetical protein